MFATKKRMILVSAIVLSIAVGLLLYFTLIFTGVINLVQRNLIFTSGSKDMIYDGETTLYCHEYDLVSGSLYFGHTMKVDYLSSLDTIGEIDNEIVVSIFDANGNVVTSKYEINYNFGKLKINSVPLRIATESSSKVYDGTKLEADAWRLLSGDVLDNHKMSVEVVSSITNVGEINNDFILTVIDNKGLDVTELYSVIKQLGTLSVTPKTLTVRTDGATTMYDGNPLKETGYNIVTEALNGDRLVVKPVGEITNVGSTPNIIEWHVLNSKNEDVSANYQINLIAGELKVTERMIQVVTSNQEKFYDGEELITLDSSVRVSNLLPNHDYKIIENSKLLDADEIENKVVLSIFDKTTLEDVTYLYKQLDYFGLLLVKPIDIVIKTGDLSKEYNNEDLICSEYEVIKGLIDGDSLLITFQESLNTPGIKENLMLFEVYRNEEDITRNYKFEYINGELELLPKKIHITTNDFNLEYRGFEYNNESFTNNNLNLVDMLYHEYVPVYQSVITNVGSCRNVIVISLSDEDKIYYDITYDFGDITVYPKNILIQTASYDKIFDDEYVSYPYIYINNELYTTNDQEDIPNYKDDYNIFEISNFINVKEIGVYYNSCTINLKDKLNYKIIDIWGGITICEESKELFVITPREIKVPLSSGTINANGYYASNSNLIGLEALTSNGFTYQATVEGQVSNNNRYSNIRLTSFILKDASGMTVAYLNSSNQIVSDLYRIQINDGIIVMTDIEITVISMDKSRDYNGFELKFNESDYSVFGLPDNYRVEVVGSIINAGTIKPNVKIYDEIGFDVTSHCIVNNDLGNLTVRKVNLNLDFGNIILGDDQKVEDLTFIPSWSNSLISRISCTYFGNRPESNSMADINNHVIVKLYNSVGKEITSNFNITITGNIIAR